MPFKHDIIPYYYQVVTPCLNEHSHLRRRDLVSELLQDLRWESSNRGPGPDRLAEFHWSNCREITSYHDLYMIYHDISTINIHKFLQKKHGKLINPTGDGISHPLTESKRSESITPHVGVSHPPPPQWGRGVTALRRASMSIYVYNIYIYMCVFFSSMQHACLFQALAFQMIADWPFFLAYNSTYGLGNIQA